MYNNSQCVVCSSHYILSQFVVKQQLCIQTKRPPKVGKKTGVIDLFVAFRLPSAGYILELPCSERLGFRFTGYQRKTKKTTEGAHLHLLYSRRVFISDLTPTFNRATIVPCFIYVGSHMTVIVVQLQDVE